MSKTYIPVALRRTVTERAKHRCSYCLTSSEIIGSPFTIDHIMPESLGGPTTYEGKVQNQEHVKSPDAFDYYLELLDPNSALHQARLKNENKAEYFKRRVLQLTLLYFFTFNRFGDSSYSDQNIISDFKTHIRPKFQASDVQAQYKVRDQIRRKLNQRPVRTALKELAKWLRDSITKKSFQERPYPFHLLIKRSLLERDLDTVLQQRTFFRSFFKNKEVLRHIAISEPRVDNAALCNFTAQITISNLHYFPTRDSQQFKMSYHVDGYQTLPVLMVPKEQPDEYRHKLRAAWSKYPKMKQIMQNDSRSKSINHCVMLMQN